MHWRFQLRQDDKRVQHAGFTVAPDVAVGDFLFKGFGKDGLDQLLHTLSIQAVTLLVGLVMWFSTNSCVKKKPERPSEFENNT